MNLITIFGGDNYVLEEEERKWISSRIFAILALQGMGIAGVIGLFWHIPHFRSFFLELESFKFWPVWIIAATAICTIARFSKDIRNRPFNLIFLPIFTVALAMILGTVVARMSSKSPEGVLTFIGIMTVICIGVALLNLSDCVPCNPLLLILFIWIMNFLAYGILCLIFNGEFVKAAYKMISPFVVATYFGITIQLLMKNMEIRIESDEFVYGAIQVSMYFMRLVSKRVMSEVCASCCPSCLACDGLMSGCWGCGDGGEVINGAIVNSNSVGQALSDAVKEISCV